MNDRPAGIDVLGRFERWKRRQLAAILKGAIERLAAESATVECYDAAITAFLRQHEMSFPMHPGRPALDRLLGLYVRHFRRELVRERRFLETAARHALMDVAG